MCNHLGKRKSFEKYKTARQAIQQKMANVFTVSSFADSNPSLPTRRDVKQGVRSLVTPSWKTIQPYVEGYDFTAPSHNGSGRLVMRFLIGTDRFTYEIRLMNNMVDHVGQYSSVYIATLSLMARCVVQPSISEDASLNAIVDAIRKLDKAIE